MTSKMLHLLSELKREMNGAVVGSMRYYGADYGLNYGVSVATIRTLARAQVKDHRLAQYLFYQEIRELRLLSLWLADPSQISTPQELAPWAKGIINSEVAEEAAFALLHRCNVTLEWLYAKDEILQYCALLSLAGGEKTKLTTLSPRLVQLLDSQSVIIPQGIIALLDRYIKNDERENVVEFISKLPNTKQSQYIREEITWRLEF